MSRDTAQGLTGAPETAPATILLALPEEYARDSFTQALRDYPRATVAHVCSDSDAAVSQVIDTRPDVALIGAGLSPLDGFATVQEIMARAPGVSALLVMKDPTPGDFRRALQAGARDMLAIPVEKKDLFGALEAAIAVSGAKRSAIDDITSRARAARASNSAEDRRLQHQRRDGQDLPRHQPRRRPGPGRETGGAHRSGPAIR